MCFKNDTGEGDFEILEMGNWEIEVLKGNFPISHFQNPKFSSNLMFRANR
jgi:hypothetical protein